MLVDEKVERDRLSANLAWLRDIDPSYDEDAAPVKIIHGDAVPVRGSVYLSLGLVWNHETILKLFRRAFS